MNSPIISKADYEAAQMLIKKSSIMIPISSATDMGSVPAELMGKFNLIFYSSPEDAVFKALGVE